MKWSAFPTLEMAFDPSIQSELDKEREIRWQIDAYFSLSGEKEGEKEGESEEEREEEEEREGEMKEDGKNEKGGREEKLLEIVGKGVTLPIYRGENYLAPGW
eukprot:CAMPEP_0201503348 /NCGR_PEP_ID=MMETSP0151_2-20130828/84613_1 /ASSEMBLY_ACC=CAM_ASM_000257 /TAXON_ID=200890 /ORGANISM="Paramoeba atlantica, Strain 621/1 / CCAP 1560/9" /LENGTH=101 /DNA_ID=CAMNT_0047896997 /DNA_START=1911 /DNA_END=2213 /DNA_ORIENTATION=-